MIARITDAWRGGADALKEARADQRALLGANPHRSEATVKIDEAGEEDALAPGEVAEPAGQQQKAAERHEEAR